ncbi:hypothetical protein RBSH_03105 [Rhodopirellula baltica SH28]|uniref:Uncharacterized protein n=1 Tax=Rhodopirellula baltica SH28 TaxID=993517 RepID=K5D4Q2_RHOBT|nr:hypothetical protein RBSH_03105 [Rhodopirellula baltica SH28]
MDYGAGISRSALAAVVEVMVAVGTVTNVLRLKCWVGWIAVLGLAVRR